MSESFQVDALTSRMCCNFAARRIYKQSPCSILKHHIFMLFHGISPVYAPIVMAYWYIHMVLYFTMDFMVFHDHHIIESFTEIPWKTMDISGISMVN